MKKVEQIKDFLKTLSKEQLLEINNFYWGKSSLTYLESIDDITYNEHHMELLATAIYMDVRKDYVKLGNEKLIKFVEEVEIKKLRLKKIDNGYMCKPDYEFKDKTGKTHLIEQDYVYDRDSLYNVYCDSLNLKTHTLKEMKEAILDMDIL